MNTDTCENLPQSQRTLRTPLQSETVSAKRQCLALQLGVLTMLNAGHQINISG